MLYVIWITESTNLHVEIEENTISEAQQYFHAFFCYNDGECTSK